ncbi:MAG: N-methyl-L-tryptophan oxidase [Gemmatimonadota bacterium]|nr:N-methyl-L-tryptophan oxidase [Gemmatimonadota bacterium]
MYDVLVVGLGAVGSATVFELAARGARVVGVDAYAPPHAIGSTHGRSRIIREAYFEHPSYVPLVQRAFARWAALEQATGTTLFRQTGGLSIGAPDCELVTGVMRSADEHGLDVEPLSREEIAARYPGFALREDMVGVFERRAGMLAPEECVRAFLQLALARGAEVKTGERILNLTRSAAGFVARSAHGEIEARRVVLSAGAWNGQILEGLGIHIPLVVTRQTMHWLAPAGDASLRSPDRLPVALIDHGDERIFYTMPDAGHGVKAAIHHEGIATSPDDVDRAIAASDTEAVRELAARFIPAVAGPIVDSAVCLYTNTPDHDFAIGVPRGQPGVVVVSACSGHGFKFASAIGEAAAQLALELPVDVDLSHFNVDRFANGAN